MDILTFTYRGQLNMYKCNYFNAVNATSFHYFSAISCHQRSNRHKSRTYKVKSVVARFRIARIKSRCHFKLEGQSSRSQNQLCTFYQLRCVSDKVCQMVGYGYVTSILSLIIPAVIGRSVAVNIGDVITGSRDVTYLVDCCCKHSDTKRK